MLEGLVSLVSHGLYESYYGGAIGDVLFQWEQMGFFSYLLPFLLIFALVFGILTKSNLFEKSINGILSLVVGLMALQFDFVPRFFAEIFPRLGVGIAVILVVIILIGLFASNRSWMTYAFLTIGVIILGVVLVQTAGALGWSSGYWWQQNWPMIVGIIFILALVGTIIGASNPSTPDLSSMIMNSFFPNSQNRT